ncbi:hypothetical protein LH464_22930 [Neorhizobium sp. T786]|uniref:hypothetical protein n=1 Tax=Pseudorhizobium xiangyangii TaxID=2883104 RepID=UPI001CFF89FD|nr:hypothetical protein [Neorhizobium xiangyangii]MCB5205320.1 hypothetical protein [Neorhizobium xiangyangii]
MRNLLLKILLTIVKVLGSILAALIVAHVLIWLFFDQIFVDPALISAKPSPEYGFALLAVLIMPIIAASEAWDAIDSLLARFSRPSEKEAAL